MTRMITQPGGNLLPAQQTAPVARHVSRWTQLLKAVVNSSVNLLASPQPDVQRAFRQAQGMGVTRSDCAASFITSLAQRLRSPQALLMMAQEPAGMAFWLPEIVQPLLSDRQHQQLIRWLLDSPQLDCTRLSRECPELYHTLIDQINQRAANRDINLCGLLLPQLLRSGAVKKALSQLHPQLPVVLWLGQLLWQIRVSGVVNALDAELRAQLHHCLAQLDGGAARQALAGENLWRIINHWVSRRIPELINQQSAGRLSSEHKSTLQLSVAAGWQVNSALNRAPASDAQLLIRVQSCYELLKAHSGAVNFAVGCGAATANQSLTSWQEGDSQLIRSLVINPQGELFTRLRLESGDRPWLMQGVSFPAQARSQPLQQLAGPDDWLTFFPPDNAGEAEQMHQLSIAAVKLTLRQLDSPSAIVPRIKRIATAWSAGSAWPFVGLAAAAVSPVEVASAATGAEVSVTEFIYALEIKYPLETAMFSRVVLSQIKSRGAREVMDREVPLSQALEMIQQRESGNPPLLLNFHPAWSKNLADDIHDYLSAKSSAPFNTSLPMDWNSAQNRRAARQIGVGHSRRNLQEITAMMKKIKSPLWNRKQWFDEVLRQLVTEHGGDTTKIKTDTAVKIFVRMPSSHNRQHIPVDRALDGTLQQIYKSQGGNYTILDIITGEFKRENIRAESKIVEFPATVNNELKQALLSINLQKKYISELEAALAEGETRQGMLELFKLLYDRAVESIYQNHQVNNIPFSTAAIRQALLAQEVYQIAWFGYALHNLVFISLEKENGNIARGLIISLWDGRVFPVTINRLSSVAFYQHKKAKELLDLIENSLPIPGRVVAEDNVGIYDDQIIINTSGRYQVEFHGKAFLRTRWREPVAEKCILSLKKIKWLEGELLYNFGRSLKLDMDYLVLTEKEHQIDTAIEVLETVGTLVSFFTIPMAITSAVGATSAATKLLAQIGSWRSSAITTSVTSVFPHLVKSLIADRPEDSKKAGMMALLLLGSEGVSFLLNKYGVRVISGVIYQGNKAVNIGYNMLPNFYAKRISYYGNRYFLAYKNIVMRTLGKEDAIAAVSEQYNFQFIDMKAPAPLNTIKQEVEGLSKYVFDKVQDPEVRLATIHSHDKLLTHIQNMFTDKGYNNEIGGIISWDGVENSQPVIDYIVKINSPAPDMESPFYETENVLIESSMTPGGFSHVIAGEDAWLKDLATHRKYLDKAVCVKWFDDMAQAKSWSQSLLSGQGMNAKQFDRLMVHRPLWYKRSIVSDKFRDLERRQSVALQEIYARESDISLDDVKIYSTDTLSLKLSYLYSSLTIVGVDLLAEKFHLLSTQDICKEATDLPEGDFLLIPTELRGMSCSDQHDITLTNYAVPRDLLLKDKLRAFSPKRIVDAGREAVNSTLYAPNVDRRLLRIKRNKNNPLLQKRLWRLKQSSAWLQHPMENIRVPLLVAVDRRKLDASAITPENHINATIPTDAISFVLTLDSRIESVSDMLSLIRQRPLPVVPMRVQDKPEWQKTLMLADKYSMFPEVANTRPEVSGKDHQPWLAVIELQATGELINQATAQLLIAQTRADDYHALAGKNPRRINNIEQLNSIQPGARLLFLDQSAGPGKPPLSHVMMALGEGEAIGSNNQLIGGKAGWEIIWLKLCNWVEDSELGFVLQVDHYKYSLTIQTRLQLTTRPVAAEPVLDQQAIKVISLAEQHIADPVASTGLAASWEKLLFLYRHAGVINMKNFATLSKQTSETEFSLFLGEGAQLVRSQPELNSAPPGSRLIFVEPPLIPGDKPRMVHAMIVSEWGSAIGVNNQRIGGDAGWQKIRLNQLSSHPDTRHGLLIESGEVKQYCIISPPLTDALVSAG